MNNFNMNNFNKNVKCYSGTCIWFDDKRGFGFIETPEIMNGTMPLSVFAHYSKIQSNENFKTLSRGQLVQFEIAETTKGPQAVNIREQKIIKTESKVVE